ncbi:MAG: hypothetical protein QXK37_02915 [Candidatus Woesearchaeota archaeon]
MPSKELIEYIKLHHAKGYSLDDIKEHLLNHGFSEEQVDAAISTINTENIEGRKKRDFEGETAYAKKIEDAVNTDKRQGQHKHFAQLLWSYAVIIFCALSIIGAGIAYYLSYNS